MYKLQYGQNYSMTSGRLWNYYRDKIDGVNDNASHGKWFIYKTKIVGKTPQRPERPERPEQPPQPPQNPDEPQPQRPPRPPVSALNVEITIPLKHLSNFWRFLDLPVINCETELDFSWTKQCVLIKHHNNIIGANFRITSTKLYVPVATLSGKGTIKFLQNKKQGFKRTILGPNIDLKLQHNQKAII